MFAMGMLLHSNMMVSPGGSSSIRPPTGRLRQERESVSFFNRELNKPPPTTMYSDWQERCVMP
jgi:hypothetical protein